VIGKAATIWVKQYGEATRHGLVESFCRAKPDAVFDDCLQALEASTAAPRMMSACLEVVMPAA